jgi:hypothetical protein
MAKRPIFEDGNLLEDLNDIVNYCIGNEKSEDVGFRERTAFPEVLAYALMNPKSEVAVKDAITKHIILEKKVKFLGDKLQIMMNRIKVKSKKY